MNRFTVMLLLLLAELGTMFTAADVTCEFMLPCRCFERHQPDPDDDLGQDGRWKLSVILDCRAHSLNNVPDLQPLKNIDVTVVWLDDNNISTIGADEIGGIDLMTLDLGNNPLHAIHPQALARVKNTLKVLRLRGAQINVTSGLGFLQGLSKLRYLDLGWNRMDAAIFPAKAFSTFGLHSLFDLCLCGLNLIALETGALQGVQSTKQLYLDSNDLKTIPADIKSLSHLKQLSLTGNIGINLTREGFAGLNKLEELILFDIDLKAYPGEALQDLPMLIKLDIAHNRDMATLTKESFPGTYPLKKLRLNYNKVTFTTDMFGRLENTLEILYIGDMGLTEIPLEPLKKLKKLKELSIDSNHFTAIHENSFAGLKLQRISIDSDKNLTYISSKAFNHMISPFELDIRTTGITSLQFMAESPPCLFGLVDSNFNNISCDCHLAKLANSGMVIGPLIGTCTFPGDVQEYSYDVNTRSRNKTQIEQWGHPDLMQRLVTQCGKHPRTYNCQATSGFVPSQSYDLLIAFLLLVVSLRSYIAP